MKIKDKFPNWLLGQGIFSSLNNLNVPWKSLNITDLDMDYIGNHSGNKYCSPLLEKLDENEALSQDNIDRLANFIYSKYNKNWVMLWKAMTTEYDPLENYNRTELTIDSVGSRTDTYTKGQEVDTYNKGNEIDSTEYGSTTITNNVGEQSNSSTIGGTTTTDNFGATKSVNENEKSAFNSGSYQDDNKSTTDEIAHTDTHDTTIRNDSQTIGAREDSSTTSTHTDTNTQGSREDTNTIGSREDSNTIGAQENIRDSVVKGNIGVLTSTAMALSEVEFREMYNFFDVVYRNIDSVLALKIY